MSWKDLDQAQDISTQISVVNEVIPLTGTFFSGASAFHRTYVNITSGSAASGGFWETIYDGTPSSVSSSALVDLTFGISTGSSLSNYNETYLKSHKQRVYKEMAGLLLGSPSSLFSFNNTMYHDLFFLMFKRRIFKDEIKKGNFSINIQLSGTGAGATTNTLSLTDVGAASNYDTGPAGDEASLFSGSTEVGKVYYNVGIVAFHTGVFLPSNGGTMSVHWSGSAGHLNTVPISGTIDNTIDGLRNRINNIELQNQTNIHSTIYFCRALNNEFNYSTNSTFIDSDGRIIPTSGTDNQTRTYITTIGLADINNNILAVAKASEPIKKSPDTELVFRVRLNY